MTVAYVQGTGKTLLIKKKNSPENMFQRGMKHIIIYSIFNALTRFELTRRILCYEHDILR